MGRRVWAIVVVVTLSACAVRARADEAAASIAAPVLTASPPPAVPSPLISKVSKEAPEPVPLRRRWIFWAGLGAAATAAVVAFFAISRKQEYSGNATPGILQAF
ncbi:MAG TPA: hypothetical protein VHJ20_05825 [Polyangia bacterium]|nr:hypothetical protein [Polyangia bacterium]